MKLYCRGVCTNLGNSGIVQGSANNSLKAKSAVFLSRVKNSSYRWTFTIHLMKENTNSEPHLSETSSHSILLISTEIQQIIFNYIFISSIKFVKKNLLNKEPQIKCLYVRQLDKRSPSLSPTLSHTQLNSCVHIQLNS